MKAFQLTFVVLVYVAIAVEGLSPFKSFFHVNWGENHAKIIDETRVQLLLDQTSGAGLISNLEYLSGYFQLRIKLSKNQSPGVVTTFFLSSNRSSATQQTPHDEIDFEFIGPKDKTYLNTNIFANDIGNREESINLWFDPTADFHTYGIIWNPHQIVFMVDNIPIRVFKNNKKDGVNYLSGPMKVEASIWNGTWAGNVDWSRGPFNGEYEGFEKFGCESNLGPAECSSEKYLWNQPKFWSLDPKQRADYDNYRKNYLFYSYCNAKPLKECQLPIY